MTPSKMIKKPINILFKNFQFNYKKFNIKPSDRPQNIDVNKYLKIVNEKKDLGPLLQAQDKFNFIVNQYPKSDYALDGG